MIPPVPEESLPEWVQEALKKPRGPLEVGDRVFGILYGEENGTVLEVGPTADKGTWRFGGQWCRVGFNLDPTTGRYRKIANGAPYYVKYPRPEELVMSKKPVMIGTSERGVLVAPFDDLSYRKISGTGGSGLTHFVETSKDPYAIQTLCGKSASEFAIVLDDPVKVCAVCVEKAEALPPPPPRKISQ